MSVVVIADSHRLCREALCDYIRHAQAAFEIAGVDDYDALKERMEYNKADLVLIDAALPGLPEEKIFPYNIGWMIPDGGEHQEGASVRGIFPRTLSSKEFLAGIEGILAGRPFFPHVEMRGHVATFKKTPQEFHLSAREREVAAFLAKGASNKEIARALDLQVVTIKLHVRGICRKLGAQNRTQAAMIAKENDLV